MITVSTEYEWWTTFLSFLQKKDSLLMPLLTIMDPQIDLPYTFLEKRKCLRSFDRMFVEFSLHYHYVQQNEESEKKWMQCVTNIFLSSIKFPESTGVFQEQGFLKKAKEKKERRITFDYEGFIFFLGKE